MSAINSLSMDMGVRWDASNPVGGGDFGTSQNKAGLVLSASPDLGTFNVPPVVARITLGAGASTTIDLTALADMFLVGQSLTGVGGFLVKSLGQPGKLEPGTSNDVAWFLGGTAPSLTFKANGGFALWDGGAVQTVDGTHKNLKLTNTGAGSGDFEIAAIGGL